MTTYQELKEQLEVAWEKYTQAKINHPYTKTLDKIRETSNKIKKLEEKQKELEKKANKQEEKYYKDISKIPCSWGDIVLTGIAKELMELNPTLNHYVILGSFGLNSEYGLWLFTEEDYKQYKETNSTKFITYSLTFFNRSEVWTGEMCNKYAKGTLGELNGGNKVCTPIESIEQINNLMHKLKKEGK